MKAILSLRPLLWLILALPGLGMLYSRAANPDVYGYGHIIGGSGKWAAWLLMLTLAVTPIRLLLRGRQWPTWLLRRRRDFGVASFGYAMGHTIIYLTDRESLDAILFELSFSDILVGWIALAFFIPLAVTSNTISTRRLGRWWKRLHWLVYPAAILMFVHWVLASFDPMTAYVHVAILAAIESLRVGLKIRQRVT